MRKLYQPRYRSILGIDITSTAVKALEISVAGDRFCVERYGREAIPSYALDGRTIKDSDAVAHSIKKLLERLHTPCKQVALAVPDSKVISKIVQINSGLTAREMEEFIFSEADKHIPYPVHEINLDFEILGHSEKNDACYDVLLVASRRENVNHRVQAAMQAGLDVVIVDVESNTVERSAQLLVQDKNLNKTIAIIDIGANYTDLFVLHEGRLVYSIEEKLGATQLIKMIAEHYQMTFEQASLAQSQGCLPADYQSHLLPPFKETILWHIKRSLQFFYSTRQGGLVEHIVLAGGMARLPGLVESVQEQENVSASIANPFLSMLFSTKIHRDFAVYDAPALMVACGLALRNRG